MPTPTAGTTPLYYNFADVLVLFNGIPLSHYGADGGVTFEYVTPEIRTSEVSADGQVHVMRNNDPRMLCKITLKSVCPAMLTLRELDMLCRMREDNGGGLGYFRFGFNESKVPGVNGNGDTCDSPVAYFQSIPAREFGKNEGEQEFVIELPNGRDEFRSGRNLSQYAVTTAPIA